VRAAKPAPEIYLYALEKLGVEAKEAIFVDDVEKNLTACEALGMKGVHFQLAEQALTEVKKLLQP
jgi:HAD superfamily hydrolase (TIGR01509 family)